MNEATESERPLGFASTAMLGAWQPIETCPQDGYVLVHEDAAIRALLRIEGKWHKPGYPALVTDGPWADVIVGRDAERVLKPLGYRLEHRDGCCENPTHWMPLPASPQVANDGPNVAIEQAPATNANEER